MALSTDEKRGKLILVHEVYAPAASQTVLVWIRTEMARLDALVSSGKALASASGNGFSTSHFAPGTGGVAAPNELFAFWSEMRLLYSTVNTDLIASGIATPTELQIVSEMLLRLVPVRNHTHDFSRAKVDYEEVTP